MVTNPTNAITSMAMKPGKLSQSDGEADEAYERHTDGRCCQCQKTAAYAHELQRFSASL